MLQLNHKSVTHGTQDDFFVSTVSYLGTTTTITYILLFTVVSKVSKCALRPDWLMNSKVALKPLCVVLPSDVKCSTMTLW